jgi:hypothetical protein
VNGKLGIVAYDPDRASLFYYVPGFTPARENRIEADIYDQMGNHTYKSSSLSFRN